MLSTASSKHCYHNRDHYELKVSNSAGTKITQKIHYSSVQFSERKLHTNEEACRKGAKRTKCVKAAERHCILRTSPCHPHGFRTTWKDGVAKENNKETYLKQKYKQQIVLIKIIKSSEPDGCLVKCSNGSVK